jgi:cytochrome c peroxidase
MEMKIWHPFTMLGVMINLVTFSALGAEVLTPKAELGRQLFFDKNLSEPAGQSCSSCHDPLAAFTDKDKTQPTSKGVDTSLHGNRSAPTVMYAAFSPAFTFDRQANLYKGGQFWDGRAKTLRDQAKGPFLNPIEMANPTPEAVIEKIKNSSTTDYSTQFDAIYGKEALNTKQAYNYTVDAIAEFERSPVFNPFTSKYDFYLLGKARFTAQEKRGLIVFESKDKGNCIACHDSRPSGTTPPLFTDFSYDNIGIPKNPDNPFYLLPPQFNVNGMAFVDLGLGGQLKLPDQEGKFKVPTLRNIALTSPYTHNGYFKTLRGVVAFYSTRNVIKRCNNSFTNEKTALQQKCWPMPEVTQNVNFSELGNLNLSQNDVNDVLAFLNTLTDGYGKVSPWPSLIKP